MSARAVSLVSMGPFVSNVKLGGKFNKKSTCMVLVAFVHDSFRSLFEILCTSSVLVVRIAC